MINPHFLRAIATLASELDLDHEYDAADCCDAILFEAEDAEDVTDGLKKAIEKLRDNEKNMDDGRFGLNDADHPVEKAV